MTISPTSGEMIIFVNRLTADDIKQIDTRLARYAALLQVRCKDVPKDDIQYTQVRQVFGRYLVWLTQYSNPTSINSAYEFYSTLHDDAPPKLIRFASRAERAGDSRRFRETDVLVIRSTNNKNRHENEDEDEEANANANANANLNECTNLLDHDAEFAYLSRQKSEQWQLFRTQLMTNSATRSTPTPPNTNTSKSPTQPLPSTTQPTSPLNESFSAPIGPSLPTMPTVPRQPTRSSRPAKDSSVAVDPSAVPISSTPSLLSSRASIAARRRAAQAAKSAPKQPKSKPQPVKTIAKGKGRQTQPKQRMTPTNRAK